MKFFIREEGDDVLICEAEGEVESGYSSYEDAVRDVKELYGDVRDAVETGEVVLGGGADYDDDSSVVGVFRCGLLQPLDEEASARYLDAYMKRDITAETTDRELQALEETYVQAAEKEGYDLFTCFEDILLEYREGLKE